jgi:hypothetical protein
MTKTIGIDDVVVIGFNRIVTGEKVVTKNATQVYYFVADAVIFREYEEAAK